MKSILPVRRTWLGDIVLCTLIGLLAGGTWWLGSRLVGAWVHDEPPATIKVIGTYPSAELYWHCDFDPAAGGVHAPIGQILFRTDVPSIYYKFGPQNTDWQILGFSAVTAGSITPAQFQGLAAGQQASTFEWNGSSWVIADYCEDPTHRWCLREDFNGGSTVCSTAGFNFVGTGTSCTVSAETDVPGMFSLHTDTNGSRITTNASGTGIVFATFPYCDTFRMRVPVLSAVGNDWIYRAGFGEFTNFGNNVDAVQVTYDRLAHGNFYNFETRSNSTSTVSTTLCPVTANAWAHVSICVAAGAASSTLIIDGNVCAINTTNIPSGNTRATALGFQAVPNTGAPTAQVDLDWVYASGPTTR